MNILIIEGEASNELGGAEMSMFSFIKFLNNQGENIFLSYQISGDWLAESNKQLFKDSINVNISSFRVQGIISYLKELNKFIKFCKQNNIDLIFTHTIHGFVFLRIANFFIRKKVVCYFKWAFSKASIGFANKWGIKCIDLAICLPSISDYWEQNGVSPKYGFHELYNGIKCESSQNNDYNKREELKRIVFFGRITHEKGIGLLVEAAEKLENICIDIYGRFQPDKNEYHFKLDKLISEKGLSKRIQFCGFVDNPIEIMKSYELAIVPSLTYEAQGRVLFEAMCSETIVFASRVGGMPDILGKYQDKLTFIPECEELVKCIQKVIHLPPNDIKQIKAYYKDRFLNNYTEQITQTTLYRLIKDLHENTHP